SLKAKHAGLEAAGKRAVKAKAGRPVYGVEMKIVDGEGRALPHDGAAVGELLVRGPWIISGYFENPEATAAAVEPDGWFHTGDVVAIDPDGYVRIADHRDRQSDEDSPARTLRHAQAVPGLIRLLPR